MLNCFAFGPWAMVYLSPQPKASMRRCHALLTERYRPGDVRIKLDR
jgi:hypothetical protein